MASEKKISRRAFATGALAASAGAVLTTKAGAAQAAPADIERVEKQLAKPLNEDAKKILEASLKASADAQKERLKTKLPENSEPCTLFIPSEHAK